MEKDRKTTLETKGNRFLFTFRIVFRTAIKVLQAELMFKWRLRTIFHLMKPDTYHIPGIHVVPEIPEEITELDGGQMDDA